MRVVNAQVNQTDEEELWALVDAAEQANVALGEKLKSMFTPTPGVPFENRTAFESKTRKGFEGKYDYVTETLTLKVRL